MSVPVRPSTHGAMNKARNSADRRRTARLQVACVATFLALGAVAVVGGPLNRPVEALFFASLALLLGLLAGVLIGRRQRRFLPLKGPGPRISQSTGWRAGVRTYRSYDTLEGPFELTEPAVGVAGLLALAKAPFVGAAILAPGALPGDAVEDTDSRWLFHTEDSDGRPVFLDEGSVLSMLAFTRARAERPTLDQALRQMERLRDRSGQPNGPSPEAGPRSSEP